jgi:CNT family concentrative nucleoside transporter
MNLVSFAGIFVLIFAAWLVSEDRRRFPWRVVIWGLLLQLVFGWLVLVFKPTADLFLRLNALFDALLAFSAKGAEFVFNSVGHMGPGSLGDYLKRVGSGSADPAVVQAVKTGTVPGFFFAFQILPTIIFFSALLSILYYLGVMQKIVLLFARLMAHTMRVSGAESLSNSANIFVGQTEAPLVVRPYIEKMTRSELMAIMVGGFSNTAGGVLGAYILMLVGFFPNIAAHLISASVLSAPAAFIFAKILVPEKEVPLTQGDVRMDVEVEDANLLDAASNGTTVGWQLAINVGAMLISFVALIALTNAVVGWFGSLFHDGAGVATFAAMAVSAAAVMAYVERRGGVSDDALWGALAAIAVSYGVLRWGSAWVASLAGCARAVALVGGAGWVAALLLSSRKRTYGAWGWGSVLGVAAAAVAVFFVRGPLPADQPLTLQAILGFVHWPVALIMGVPPADCLVVGRLLGEKLIMTEFVAYLDLSAYLGSAARGEVPALDPRSIVILSYALCGFANFASIGIQIGGIAPLAPSRRHEIARLGFKAMVGGALATFMIACVAGTFYTGRSMLGGG